MSVLFSLGCLALFGIVFPVAATSFFDSTSVDLAATARYYIHEQDRNKTVKNQFSHGVKGELKLNKSSDRVKFILTSLLIGIVLMNHVVIMILEQQTFISARII